MVTKVSSKGNFCLFMLSVSQLYLRSSLLNCLFRRFFAALASRLLSNLLMGRGEGAADKMRGKREAHLKAASSFCVCLLRLTAKKLQPRRGFDPFHRFLPSTALCKSFSPPVLVRAATTHCDSCRPNFLPISQLYERSSLRNCLFR